MKTLKYILMGLILFPLTIKAQEMTPAINTTNYNFAIGLRGGNTSGLTLKKNYGGHALEGIIGLWSHGFHGTLLYEKNVATTVSGLNWYYGGGGHASVYTGRIYNHYHPHGYWNHRHDHLYASGVGLGVDGVLGIEYKIPPIPFAISLDVKPFIEVTSSGNVWGALDTGLGIKFTF